MTVLGLAGCKQNPELPAMISPYRIDIQQGNVVSQEMVGKLKAGMTRSQVRFVLGSPLVVDMFHADRWDYVYLLQRQGKPDERRRLTVIFDGDKLQRVEGDVVLTDKMLEPEPAAPPPPAAATPATKPAPTKPPAATAAPAEKKPAEKPPVAATPAAKPETSVTGKPAAASREKTATDAASKPPADAAKADTTKTDAKAEGAANAAKTDAEKADDKQEPAKKRGFFDRLRDKMGM